MIMTSLYKRLAGRGREPRPPGPGHIEFARSLADFRRHGLAALERLAGRYGNVVYVNVPGRRSFLFNHPDLVHHVLIKNRDNYLKTQGSKNVRQFFGDAMQLNNGAYARHMRHIMAPVFQPDRVAAAYTGLIVETTRVAIAAWQPGTRQGLARRINELALDIAVQIHFGTAHGEDTKHVGRLFLAAVSPLSNFMMPYWMPTRANRRYHEAVAQLDGEIARRIHACRTHDTDNPGLLAAFVRLAGDDAPAMSDRQIRNEIVTMMSAGFQTVATALMQTLRLVAEHSAVDTLLFDELCEVTGCRPPVAADLARLTYADKVIKESLRCCPPAGLITRRAAADDTVDGWKVPAGSRVFLSAWLMHRDARFYDEPLAFRPERWTPEFERALPLCAYFPFGRGPRACIAGFLATYMLQLMLATIVGQYRLEACGTVAGHPPSRPDILTDDGLQVMIHSRPIAEPRDIARSVAGEVNRLTS